MYQNLFMVGQIIKYISFWQPFCKMYQLKYLFTILKCHSCVLSLYGLTLPLFCKMGDVSTTDTH